ncbi:hypothetical protein JUJ52_08620 [Virgibacillus sp. AGTR]|uniref:hypothetical protein n=1 Tax=Virgibacillus sp. AGTR TaxID=2812055 RepID=UPI001D16DF28|nr:hypothetical protein [Virgibacillus sp. AGTR]MCC2250028.1 hypothetical protein [Virgibacillus sp. AGTR]
MSSKMKQKIQFDKLQHLQINMNGQKLCYEGSIEINGLQLEEGISSVELILKASKSPEVIVEYHPRLIKQEVAVALGLTIVE